MSQGFEATGRTAFGRENDTGRARRPGERAQSPQVAASRAVDLGAGGRL